MKSNTTETWILWLLVAILLLTSVFVVSDFRKVGLNSSEDNSVRHLYNFNQRFSLAETIDSVDRTSPQHMPAYHVQLSLWADLVGFDFGMLRTLSLYPLLLSIAFTFRLGRDLFDQKSAFLAAVFVAFSAYFLYFGHEIRMYTLTVAQAVSLFWLYWRIAISPKPERGYHFVVLFLLSAYSIYTHSVLIFPLVAIGIYHVLFVPKNRMWIKVTVTEVLAGATFLYWLPKLIDGTRNIKDLTETNQTAIQVLGSSLFAYTNGFWIGGLILIVVALWQYPRKDHHFRYLMTLILVTLGGMILFNVVLAYIPLERMRYTVVWLPVIAILWGIGLSILWRYSQWFVVAILAVWIGFFVWFMRSEDIKEYANISTQDLDIVFPFHNLTDVLRDDFLNYASLYNNVVVFDSVFYDEYEASELQYYSLLIDKKDIFKMTPDTDPDVIENQYDLIADGEPGFWLAYRPDDADLVEEWQDIPRIQDGFDRYRMCFETPVNDLLYMTFYLDRELSCAVLDHIEREAIVYDNGYVLRNYSIEETDNMIEVSFLWDSAITFDNSYGYSLQVFHNGEKVGQVDSPVHAIVTFSAIPLDITSAGDYEIHMILYASDTVASVGGQTDSGVTFERDVHIGQVTFDA